MKIIRWFLVVSLSLLGMVILIVVLSGDDEAESEAQEQPSEEPVGQQIASQPEPAAKPTPSPPPKPAPAKKPPASTDDAPLDVTNENYGRIMARGQANLEAAKTFCSFFESGMIVGVTADGPILNLWVTEVLARGLMNDQLKGKQTVLDLMAMCGRSYPNGSRSSSRSSGMTSRWSKATPRLCVVTW